jgi:hypothetical protein
MPNHELTAYDRPQPVGQPLDPLTAKRAKQARRDAAFTREQQQVIGEILETWWNQKMAGIETQKVIEATETLPRELAELAMRVEMLEGKRPKHIVVGGIKLSSEDAP